MWNACQPRGGIGAELFVMCVALEKRQGKNACQSYSTRCNNRNQHLPLLPREIVGSSEWVRITVLSVTASVASWGPVRVTAREHHFLVLNQGSHGHVTICPSMFSSLRRPVRWKIGPYHARVAQWRHYQAGAAIRRPRAPNAFPPSRAIKHRVSRTSNEKSNTLRRLLSKALAVHAVSKYGFSRRGGKGRGKIKFTNGGKKSSRDWIGTSDVRLSHHHCTRTT